MTAVVISPSNVVTFPEGGGHFWVYMQYVQGLMAHGVEVFWLEEFPSSGDEARDARMLAVFEQRMARYGLGGRTILYRAGDPGATGAAAGRCFIGTPEDQARDVIARADLLLNFCYGMSADLLHGFRRTALVDIDPGLLQFWIWQGQIAVAPHDVYFTTGETTGTARAAFPDCGLAWEHIRPPVSLECWPFSYSPECEAFTTVSGWWGGGGKGEFITDGKGLLYENNKRVTFLQFVDLPRLSGRRLELALSLGDGDAGQEHGGAAASRDAALPAPRHERVTDYLSDAADRDILESHGWRVRHAKEVASTPEAYRAYIQRSRGEFSCVKPSCIRFRNAWISDRTICYLASGKPVVVQDTGPSRILPNGAGMFRFSSPEQAARAFDTIDGDYERHCREARRIAETLFDARTIVARILEVAC